MCAAGSLAAPCTQQPGGDEPRTVTGKWPTAASLQREREYMDWLSTRQAPEGEAQSEDSWAVFMAERRARLEKARLSQLSARRKE